MNHAAPRLEIKNSIVPDTMWHWSIIMPSGHCFCISASFETFEAAIADANRNAPRTMRLAISHMDEVLSYEPNLELRP